MTPDKEREQNKVRVRRYQDKKRASGLCAVTVWVKPGSPTAQIRALADKLNGA